VPLTVASARLLERFPDVLPDLAIEVHDPAGAGTSQGTSPVAPADARVDLPNGAEVRAWLGAASPGAQPALVGFVDALLAVVGERERLEADMDSMTGRSLQLMEIVHQIGEALPRLSIGADEAEIAKVAVDACLRAADAKRIVYLSYVANKGLCEVQYAATHAAVPDDERDDPALALDRQLPADAGLLGELFAQGCSVQHRVDGAGRRGDPGTPEHLARSCMLAVPVTYGSDDKAVVIGALVLCDKVDGALGGNEFGSQEVQVAETFALMLGAVVGAKKTAELGKELNMAQAIQRQILPSRPAKVAGFDIAADYQACGAVGGDYFDYVRMADGRTMVVVADVSGHNLASGMMMVSARATLRTLAAVRSCPVQVFDEVAATMFDDLTQTERFLTAAAVVLAPDDQVVEYVCAGHNDLMVYRAANDRVERVAAESTILGFLPAPGYEARRIALQPGDCLLLFTDGITEAMDVTGEMFGEERLAALLAQIAPRASARRIVDGVTAALTEFRGAEMGTDDVTAVVIRCEPRRTR
jgi:hypothetical protein